MSDKVSLPNLSAFQAKADILRKNIWTLQQMSHILLDNIKFCDEDLYRLIVKRESGWDMGDALLDLIISDLQSGCEKLHMKLMEVLEANDHVIFTTLHCQYASWTLLEYSPYLIKHLDAAPFLKYMSHCLSCGEPDDINATRNRGEKVSKFLDALDRRLQAQDTSLYDRFIDLLAGLYPEAFKLLNNREPTIEQAVKCIASAQTQMRKDIKDKGHITDKSGDKKINFDKNFIRLCLTEQTSKEEKFSWDNQTPDVYQMYISDKERREIQPEDILVERQDHTFLQNNDQQCPSKSCNTTVIQGRAGIGKSTLMQYLCQLWADKSWANDFQLLFFLRLRVLQSVDYKVSLHELLTTHSTFNIGKDNLPSQWLQNWNKAILVKVDGLDEFRDFAKQMQETCEEITSVNEKAMPFDIIINLLRGNLMPGCHIVCASRPFEGLYKLNIKRDLEVMGLTKDNVLKFIKMNVDQQMAAKILQHFENSPVLMSMCAITYYCSVICQLIAHDQWIPEYDTMSYTRLTAHIIMSYVRRETDNKVTVLKYQDCFKFLADLAFKGIFDKSNSQGVCKLAFDECDLLALPKSCHKTLKLAQKAGLLEETQVCFGRETRSIWEFAHLSLQEFFASLKLLSYSSECAESLRNCLKQVTSDGQLNMLRLFLYGVAFDKESHEMNQLKSSMGVLDFQQCRNALKELLTRGGSDHVEKHQQLQKAQIAYEAQNSEISELTHIISENGILHMSDVPINAVDITALVHVALASSNLCSIHLRNSNLDDYSCSVLAESLILNPKTVKSLDLGYNQIGIKGLQALYEMLHKNDIIDHLNLDGNGVDSEGMRYLMDGLSKKRQSFSISLAQNNIGDAGILILTNFLSNVKSIHGIDISHNNISEKGIHAFHALFSRMACASIISMDGNMVTDATIDCLLKHITDCSKVQSLTFSDTLLTDSAATKIADNLKGLSSLRNLGLGNCQIGTKGASCLLKSRDHFSHLHIDLSGNQIDTSQLPDVSCFNVKDNFLSEKRASAVVNASVKGKCFRILDLASTELTDNCIETILSKCKGIEEIRLQNNKLTNESLKCIARYLSNKNELRVLDLAHNQFTEVGLKYLVKDMFEPNTAAEKNTPLHLKHLDLQSMVFSIKGIRRLSQIFQTCTNLEIINLSNTGVNCAMTKLVAEGLASLNLVELDLSNNSIGDIGSQHLAEALCLKPCLRALALDYNDITSSGGRHLANLLHKHTDLLSLALCGNSLQDSGLEDVCKAISHHKHVQDLRLGTTHMKDRGALAVSNAIKEMPDLQHLDVSNNIFTDVGFKHIAKAMANLNVMKILDMSNNSISSTAVQSLAEIIGNFPLFSILSLHGNKLSDQGICYLSEGLKSARNLKHLDLRNNGITFKGVETLVSVLNSNFDLALSNNPLGDNGVQVFSDCFNRNIVELSLENTRLTAMAMEAIKHVLEKNSHLNLLNLSQNSIGDAGAEIIAGFITRNQCLAKLYLRQTGISDHGATELSKSLKMYKAMTALDLSENSLTSLGTANIIEALQNHSNLKQLHLYGYMSNIIISKEMINMMSKWFSEKKLRDLSLSIAGISYSNSDDILKISREVPNLTYFHIKSTYTPIEVNSNQEESKDREMNLNMSSFLIFKSETEVQESVLLKLQQLIAHIESISEFSMSAKMQREVEAEMLTETLQKSTQLKELSLCTNSLRPTTLENLSVALQNHPQLSVAHLDRLGFDDNCVQSINNILLTHENLTKLTLSQNSITNHGFQEIVKAIAEQNGNNLRLLDLSFNDVTSCESRNLFDLVISKSTLRNFSFHGNKLKETAAKILIQNMTIADDLEQISLSMDMVSNMKAMDLTKSLRSQLEMTFVHIQTTVNVYLSDISGDENCKHQSMSTFVLFRTDVDLTQTIAPILQELVHSEGEVNIHTTGHLNVDFITKTLVDTSHLKMISLNQTNIDSENLISFCNVLKKQSKLAMLDLSSTSMDDHCIAPVMDILQECKELSSLLLSKNSMTDVCMQNFVEALKDQRDNHLKLLDLSYNGITSLSAKSISALVNGKACLNSLYFHGNKMEQGHVTDFIETLEKDTDLHELSLSMHLVPNSVASEMTTGIRGQHRFSQIHVQTIDSKQIFNKDLGEEKGIPDGISTLILSRFDAYKYSRRVPILKELIQHRSEAKFSIYSLGHLSMVSVTDSLFQTCNLKELCLNEAFVSNKDLQYLCDALNKQTELTMLDLKGTHINDKCISSIKYILNACKSLSCLYLSKNEITDVGAEDLKKWFVEKRKNNMQKLDLSQNNLTSGGVFWIAEALLSHSSLTNLYLHGIELDTNMAKHIMKKIRRRRVLREVSFSLSSILHEEAEEMTKHIRGELMLSLIHIIWTGNTRASGNNSGKHMYTGTSTLLMFKADGSQRESVVRVLQEVICSYKYGDEGSETFASNLYKKSIVGKLPKVTTMTKAKANKEQPRVSEMKMYGNSIGDEGIKYIAKALSQSKHLTVLNLSENHICASGAKHLAAALENSTHFKELYLLHNILEDDGVKALFQYLQNCHHLKKFVFSSSGMGDEGAMVLGKVLSEKNKLEMINVNNNRISSVGAEHLAKALAYHTNLTDMQMQGNSIGDIGAKYIADALSHSKHLTVLSLSENNIGPAGANYLAAALKKHTKLKHLCLHGNNLEDAGVKVLSQSLENCHQLKKLSLYSTHMGDEGAMALGKVLSEKNKLEMIHVNNNKISSKGAEHLAKALAYHPNLTDIHMQGNSIGDIGAKCLADALSHSKLLTVLELSENSIGAEGAKHLAVALQTKTQLKELCLCVNDLQDEGVKILSQSLKHCNQLNKLSLSSMGDEGAMALGNILSNKHNLEWLYIYTNKISSKGAVHLAKALAHHPNLSEVRMHGKSIGDIGAKCMADALSYSRCLTGLILSENKIGAEGVRHLEAALQKHTQLEVLWLEDNKLEEEGAKAVSQSLQHCYHLKKLSLSSTDMGERGALPLGHILSDKHELEWMYIYKNRISSKVAEHLAKALAHHPNLTDIHMNGNSMGDIGAKYMADALLHSHHLTVLELSENNIGVEGAKHLAVALQTKTQLKELWLHGNNLEDEGVTFLSQSLKHCYQLKKLSLQFTHMGNEGAMTIGNTLLDKRELELIDVSNNKISLKGTKHLVKALRHHPNLSVVRMDENSIGDIGARHIAAALSHSKHLTVLSLSEINIGADGANYLAPVIQNQTQLMELWLRGNQLKDEGVKVLSQSLQHCYHLKKLSLQFTGMGDEGARAIVNMLSDKHKLELIYLKNRKISSKCAEHLKKALTHYPNISNILKI